MNLNLYNDDVEPFLEESDGFCRICGDKNYGNITGICEGCAKKFWEDHIRKSIPKDSKVHFFKCWSHIKACKCKDTEKLRDISK